MRGITEIQYVSSGLGKTPAATNRKTGVVYINLPEWDKLKPEHRLYVLLHELGHIVLDTSDELAADKFAFDEYVKLGYPLTEAVYALSKVLTMRSPEHMVRTQEQLKRALNYDASVNGNKKAGTALLNFFMTPVQQKTQGPAFLSGPPNAGALASTNFTLSGPPAPDKRSAAQKLFDNVAKGNLKPVNVSVVGSLKPQPTTGAALLSEINKLKAPAKKLPNPSLLDAVGIAPKAPVNNPILSKGLPTVKDGITPIPGTLITPIPGTLITPVASVPVTSVPSFPEPVMSTMPVYSGGDGGGYTRNRSRRKENYNPSTGSFAVSNEDTAGVPQTVTVNDQYNELRRMLAIILGQGTFTTMEGHEVSVNAQLSKMKVALGPDAESFLSFIKKGFQKAGDFVAPLVDKALQNVPVVGNALVDVRKELVSQSKKGGASGGTISGIVNSSAPSILPTPIPARNEVSIGASTNIKNLLATGKAADPSTTGQLSPNDPAYKMMMQSVNMVSKQKADADKARQDKERLKKTYMWGAIGSGVLLLTFIAIVVSKK